MTEVYFVWIFKKLLKILKMRTNSNFLQKSANSKREGIFKYLQISNCKVDFCKKIASSKRESEFSNICKFQSLKFWILSEYLKNCNDLWKTKTSVCGSPKPTIITLPSTTKVPWNCWYYCHRVKFVLVSIMNIFFPQLSFLKLYFMGNECYIPKSQLK